MIEDLNYLLFVISVLLMIGWAMYFVFHIMAIFYARCKLHRPIEISDDGKSVFPAVSIIKPLTGVDCNLLSNLETFFTLKYPQYELLLCLENENDPALMLVQSLMAKFPNVDAQIFVGGQRVGVNPKINNMMPGYQASKYDLIMISDAGMRMLPDTLSDMVSSMTYKVGTVTQMPFTCDRPGFAAIVEKIYFGTAHARIYLLADFFGVICSTGMSSMFRKKVLEEVGGIKAFAAYLPEDYYFASAIAAKGWKCAISSQPGWQNSGTCNLNAFHSRLERWTKLRTMLVPLTSALEPLQECFLLGFLTSLASNALFGWNSLLFLVGHVTLWMILDYVLLKSVQGGALPFTKREFILAWLYRETSALPLFLKSLCNMKVSWRSRSYHLKWGGEAEEISPSNNKYMLFDA